MAIESASFRSISVSVAAVPEGLKQMNTDGDQYLTDEEYAAAQKAPVSPAQISQGRYGDFLRFLEASMPLNTRIDIRLEYDLTGGEIDEGRGTIGINLEALKALSKIASSAQVPLAKLLMCVQTTGRGKIDKIDLTNLLTEDREKVKQNLAFQELDCMKALRLTLDLLRGKSASLSADGMEVVDGTDRIAEINVAINALRDQGAISSREFDELKEKANQPQN